MTLVCGPYSSTEKQSMYSTVPAHWEIYYFVIYWSFNMFSFLSMLGFAVNNFTETTRKPKYAAMKMLKLIAIADSNGESASPWNIPVWILILAKVVPPPVNSTLLFFNSPHNELSFFLLDISYILRQSVIQLFGTIL